MTSGSFPSILSMAGTGSMAEPGLVRQGGQLREGGDVNKVKVMEL